MSLNSQAFEMLQRCGLPYRVYCNIECDISCVLPVLHVNMSIDLPVYSHIIGDIKCINFTCVPGHICTLLNNW